MSDPNVDQVQRDLESVHAFARDALSQEFQRSLRLEDKSRNQMTLGGAWFATVQAVAGGALGIQDLSAGVAASIGALALLSVVALIGSFVCHARVLRLSTTNAISPKGLLDMAGAAGDSEGKIGSGLVIQYANHLQDWRSVNRDKAGHLRTAEVWWYAALAFALLELVVAVSARAF